MSLSYQFYRGSEIQVKIEDLAALRISVFREYPYLYDGDLEYEKTYLQTLVRSSGSLVVLVFDAGRVVGASTALPLADEEESFQGPFHRLELRVQDYCYFGESVLLDPYRRQGVGHKFFDLREEHARRLGLLRTCFCSVVRPDSHPLKPSDHVPLDAFWSKRGYRPREGLTTEYSWKDIDHHQESPKLMQFWEKDLVG